MDRAHIDIHINIYYDQKVKMLCLDRALVSSVLGRHLILHIIVSFHRALSVHLTMTHVSVYNLPMMSAAFAT